MNTNDIKLLLNISNLISSETDIFRLSIRLKKYIPHLDSFNVYLYDENTKKLKDVVNNFSLIDDIIKDSADIYNNFEKLQNCNFILNNEEQNINILKNEPDLLLKSIILPLKAGKKISGMVEFSLKEAYTYNVSSFNTLFILTNQILLWVQNRLINQKLQINSGFNESLKNIAKIIESQYEIQYILPLIGEMIDKFISNHLIYIFLKKDSKFELFWPNACRDENIYNLISKLESENYIISDNQKIGAFPLVINNSIFGCIVAHSTIDKLSQTEINYIQQLTKQSSTTIERANVYAETLKSATLDALTGINNRRQFEIRLKQEYSSAIRQNNPLCAIMIDIDFFKKINDTYGHATGDLVLKTVAEIIKEQLREYDIPSRYGGEEFCILLPQTKIEEAHIVAQRLRAAVEDSVIDEEQEIKVTISVGLAQLKEKDMPEDLYKRADKALYEAKERGRNRVICYD